MPSDTEQQAYDAALRAERHHDLTDVVRAIILYEWLVVAFQHESREVAHLQNNLGNAYGMLPGGDRQANLKRAVAYLEAALAVYELAQKVYYTQMVDRTLRRAREELEKLEQD